MPTVTISEQVMTLLAATYKVKRFGKSKHDPSVNYLYLFTKDGEFYIANHQVAVCVPNIQAPFPDVTFMDFFIDTLYDETGDLHITYNAGDMNGTLARGSVVLHAQALDTEYQFDVNDASLHATFTDCGDALRAGLAFCGNVDRLHGVAFYTDNDGAFLFAADGFMAIKQYVQLAEYRLFPRATYTTQGPLIGQVSAAVLKKLLPKIKHVHRLDITVGHPFHRVCVTTGDGLRIYWLDGNHGYTPGMPSLFSGIIDSTMLSRATVSGKDLKSVRKVLPKKQKDNVYMVMQNQEDAVVFFTDDIRNGGAYYRPSPETERARIPTQNTVPHTYHRVRPSAALIINAEFLDRALSTIKPTATYNVFMTTEASFDVFGAKPLIIENEKTVMAIMPVRVNAAIRDY
jgi:hypothetical protein